MEDKTTFPISPLSSFSSPFTPSPFSSTSSSPGSYIDDKFSESSAENGSFISEKDEINDGNTPENRKNTIVGRAIEQLKRIEHVASGRFSWKGVEKRFDQLSWTGPGLVPVLNRADFARCIDMKEAPEFADELLAALEGRRQKHQEISKSELYCYWHRISNPSFRSRSQILFNLCDRKMDGKISESEIKQVILWSASANKLRISPEEAEEHALDIMDELDPYHRGYVELSQLEKFFGECTQNVFPASGNQVPATYSFSGKFMVSKIEILFRKQWRRIWIVMFWLATCISLFTWKFLQYRNRSSFEVMGYCVCVAKGAAETLKFNMALILLPVSRNTVTWLRKNRTINSIIPFNDNINFHKVIAGGIMIGVGIHGTVHLACDFPRIARADHLVFRRTIGRGFHYQQPSYMDILTTTEVLIGIIMVILMAIAFPLAMRLSRRNASSLPSPLQRVAGFNSFWYSHHLFIAVYTLLLIHSMFLFLTSDTRQKTTWMYLAIPLLIYICERIMRAIRACRYDVKFIKASIYPGNVLSLKFHKPPGFQYRSGMYIFIQCPQISQFEWHPFSLTSAPGDDHLSVHIRTHGDWSHEIYHLFQEALLSGRSELPKIRIDGPYGAASQDHVKYDIVVLVGLGIGATPFISVLKDILHGLQKPQPKLMDDGESGMVKGPSKVYFYWVTREQGSFDWFRDVMEETCDTHPKQDVIEIHNYLSSVFREGDMRSTLISALQSLSCMKNGIDIVSKTPVRTHFSRPNWKKVFSGIATTHGGQRIGVFYCGPPTLSKELENLCTDITSTTTTRFVFHKENY